MDFRYREFDAEAAGREQVMRRLRNIFHDLLLQANGDVERALEFMRAVGERHGLFARGVSYEDFVRHLEREEEIRRGPGGLRLTPRGERVIRQESLDAPAGRFQHAA